MERLKLRGAALFLLVFAAASTARASDAPAADAPAPMIESMPDLTAPSRACDRTWLYNDNAAVAEPLTLVAISSTSYTDSGASTRAGSPFPYTYNAFGNNTAQPGAQLSVGGELGVIDRVSVLAIAQLGIGSDGQVGTAEGTSNGLGGTVSVRVRLTSRSWTRFRMVASGGYVREAWEGPVYDDDANVWRPGAPGGANGAWAQLAASGDEGRFRWAASVHLEHVFSQGRDPADVMMQMGASYALLGPLRAGAEWVGQDLEESFSPGAEGGARHFIGPTASLQFFEQRLSIVAGPSVGISSTSPKVVGRAALSFGF